MKLLQPLLVLMLFTPLVPVWAQQDKDNYLVGVWETQDGSAHVKIIKSSGYFYGSIIWLKDSLDAQNKPKVDKNNPDPGKQDRPLLGTEILWGMKYDADKDVWYNGHIYDPGNGKTYTCKITKDGDLQISIREYNGMAMMGRSVVWKRVK